MEFVSHNDRESKLKLIAALRYYMAYFAMVITTLDERVRDAHRDNIHPLKTNVVRQQLFIDWRLSKALEDVFTVHWTILVHRIG